MIRNQWYVVLESKELKQGKPLGVTRLGEKLVFWRTEQGQAACMADRCPHIGAPLCLGQVQADRLACPFHGFEFDTSGRCQYIPSLGRNGKVPKAMKVNSYPVYEAHGWIWIYWGEPEGELKPPKWFDIEEDCFSTSSFHEHWPVHYSRMAENQLDVAHLAFIHHNTIGRGKRMVVDGPQIKIEDNTLYLWVYNRPDDGTPPRRAEELPEPTRPPFLVFNFPNLWQNRISEDVRIVAAFVPVDDENSMFYIRNYQRFFRVPVLHHIVDQVQNAASKFIAHQDRDVVSYQLPKKSELKKLGEKLVPADGAILAFRKRRHELKVLSGQIDD
jgi:phenylpropionate dioxygenase-like ring-hydroxylating dioxygenase large terminal subunit